MINFSSISTSNNQVSARVQTQVKSQKDFSNNSSKAPVYNFQAQSKVDSSLALKAQAAMFNIKFNNSFYSSIQYLNTQASVNLHNPDAAKAVPAAKEPAEVTINEDAVNIFAAA